MLFRVPSYGSNALPKGYERTGSIFTRRVKLRLTLLPFESGLLKPGRCNPGIGIRSRSLLINAVSFKHDLRQKDECKGVLLRVQAHPLGIALLRMASKAVNSVESVHSLSSAISRYTNLHLTITSITILEMGPQSFREARVSNFAQLDS